MDEFEIVVKPNVNFVGTEGLKKGKDRGLCSKNSMQRLVKALIW